MHDPSDPIAKLPAPAAPAGRRVNRSAGPTLGAQLAHRVAERIQCGGLGPGARLPSVREGARLHGLSPSTVVAAYDQLQAQGLVEARRQRGFFVREAQAPTCSPAALSAPQVSLTLPAPVDATALIRGMFQQGSLPGGPGMGTLPESWLDRPLLDRALRRTIAHAPDALRYGDPAGDVSLRQSLSRRLGGELGDRKSVV